MLDGAKVALRYPRLPMQCIGDIMSDDLKSTLAERGARYGTFLGNARISQELKRVLRKYCDDRPGKFRADQLEAFDMFCTKISRIIEGDPNWADSWRDIAGFAMLVADEIPK